MEVTLYHLSIYGKKVRSYTHENGIRIKRVPVSFKGLFSKEEYSFQLLKELSQDKPSVIFSVTHIMGAILDMYDLIVLYAKLKGIKIAARNPGADTYGFIFGASIRKRQELKALQTRNSRLHFKGSKLYIKVLWRTLQAALKFSIKKYSLKNTALIIPQTQTDFNHLINVFKLDESKISLLPKPVDTDKFKEISKDKAASKLGLKSDCKYLLHVSNLFNSKGCENIIKVLPELFNDFPGIKLLVSGGGPKKEELALLSKCLGVENEVIFLGHVSHADLVYYYNIADVFVLPTEIDNEGQPNVIMEAIACNTPVISTNLPGPSSIISEGLGLIVSIGRLEELYVAIKNCLNYNFILDPVARNRFLKDYSLSNVGNLVKQKFDQL